MNTDALSHRNKSLDSFLQTAEKKNKYLDYCLHKRRQFSPFSMLMDGIKGMATEDTLKIVAIHPATKLNQPYLRMTSYIKSRLAIALVRETHSCIRGSHSGAQDQRTATAIGGWGRLTPLPLKNHRKTKIKFKMIFNSLQYERAKKWRPKVLFLRTDCERRFTTIVTDSITISSTRT